MKAQSVVKYLAAMVLIPTTGYAVANSVVSVHPALADTLAPTNSTIAQNAPNQAPTIKKQWGHRGGSFFKQLNLTSDQQAQIKSIREEAKSSSQGLRQQIKAAHQQLRTLLASNDASDSALLQAQQQMQSLRQQLGAQRFETMLKIRNVLTPAQRTQLSELRKQSHHHRHHHHRQQQSTTQTGTAS